MTLSLTFLACFGSGRLMFSSPSKDAGGHPSEKNFLAEWGQKASVRPVETPGLWALEFPLEWC